MEHRSILQSMGGGLEGSLMHIRIKSLLIDGRVEALQAMFLERLHQDRLRHLEAVVEVDQIFVRGTRARRFVVVGHQFLGGDGGQGSVEIVDRIDQVLRETLDRE